MERPDTPPSAQLPHDLHSLRSLPATPQAEGEGRSEANALALGVIAMSRHDRWCGYNPDAPGDPSFREFLRAASAAIPSDPSPFARRTPQGLRTRVRGAWSVLRGRNAATDAQEATE
jgi:hypothetical protein